MKSNWGLLVVLAALFPMWLLLVIDMWQLALGTWTQCY